MDFFWEKRPKNGVIGPILLCHKSVTICIIKSEGMKKSQKGSYYQSYFLFCIPLTCKSSGNSIEHHEGSQKMNKIHVVKVTKEFRIQVYVCLKITKCNLSSNLRKFFCRISSTPRGSVTWVNFIPKRCSNPEKMHFMQSVIIL